MNAFEPESFIELRPCFARIGENKAVKKPKLEKIRR